jgi:hypothetical protein
MERFRILFFSVLMMVSALPATPAAQSGRRVGPEVLTNESIQAMTTAGLSSAVIVAKIRASKPSFDVSAQEIIRLKQAGVQDEVINAMIDAVAETSSNDRAPLTRSRRVSETDTPETPAVPEVGTPPESGIYYAPEPLEVGRLVMLEPNVYIQSKETGVWKSVLTKGIAKVRNKAVLPGSHARVRIETRRPIFYFFFDVKNAGLSSAGTVWGPATSANEFVLARLDVRKSTRELGVGERGDYTGQQTGVSGKSVRAFDYEKLAPGVYKVRPKEDLDDGEYCFFFAGAVAASGGGGGPKLFDFGIGTLDDAQTPNFAQALRRQDPRAPRTKA